jgi:cystine transport system substrate-binding protein
MKIILFVFAALAAVSCSTVAPHPELIIATDATFAPFHFMDENGVPTGFDIELARAVATDAGFEPRVVVLSYSELFSGLKAGTHDVVAATTGITDARRRLYQLGLPYFETCQVAVVRAGGSEPNSLAGLKGGRIGAAGSGTSYMAMQKIDAVAIRLNDGEGLSSLESGAIDAWIVDEFDGVSVAQESQGRLRVLSQPVALERYAFVYSNGGGALKRQLDHSLEKLKKNGVVAELEARFGVRRDANWPVEW